MKGLNIENCNFTFLEIPIEIDKNLDCKLTSQKISQPAILDKKTNKYTLDMKKLVPNLKLLTILDIDQYKYNRETGIVTFKDKPQQVDYFYYITNEQSCHLLEVSVTIDETAEPINVRINKDSMKPVTIIVLVVISVLAASILAYIIYKKNKKKNIPM